MPEDSPPPAEGVTLDQVAASKSPEEQAKLYAQLAEQFGAKALPPGVGATGLPQPGQVTAADPTAPPPEPVPPAPVEDGVEPPPEGEGEKAPDGLKIPEKPAEPETNVFELAETDLREKGEISEQVMKQITDLGIPQTYVERFVAGQEAMAAQAQTQVYGMVGGEDTFAKMVDWAGKSLSPQEIAAFNQTVTSGDMAATEMAVRGMEARWRAAPDGGAPPAVRIGGGRQHKALGAEPFGSPHEMMQAMNDVRYSVDAGYREQVQARLLATDPKVTGG